MNNIVVFSQSRTAPEPVLRGLREIDPAADLVYCGGGRWWLGRVRPNQHRRALAVDVLNAEWKNGQPSDDTLRLCDLAMQGFAIVEEYDIQGSPDSRIVEDFRRRMHVLRTDGEGEFRRRWHESSGEPAKERLVQAMRDRIDAVAGDAYRWAFNKPVSVLAN